MWTCSHASAEPAMQVDQIMQWFATKRKGRQRYATIYWHRPSIMASVVQVAHPAQSLRIVVSHNATAVTSEVFFKIKLNIFWIL